jgi:serine/threonine protein kinase
MALATTTTTTSALRNDMVVMEEDDMDLIDIHNLIGSGSSAQVYLGKHTKLNLSMAVKLMKKDTTTERGRKRINRARNEGLTMAALQHKNICKVFGTLETKKYVVLLLEYCKGGAHIPFPLFSFAFLVCFFSHFSSNSWFSTKAVTYGSLVGSAGDLFDKLNNFGPMSEEEARRYFLQLVDVVNFMHVRGYIHRDIKPENILVDEAGNLILTDFGFARQYDYKQRLDEWVGTLQYTSPEIVSQTPYVGPEVDVWACGTVLLAMLTARVPFSAQKESQVVRKIKAGDFSAAIVSSGANLSPEVMQLLRHMLEPNVNKRATMEDVLAHPWVRGEGMFSTTVASPY